MSPSVRRGPAYGAGLALIAGLTLTALHQASSAPPKEAAPGSSQAQISKPDRTQTRPAPVAGQADEQAIHDAAAGYVKAFNAGDAKALAAMFTEQGKVVDATGQSVKGREQIEQMFAATFKTSPGVKVDVQVDSVELLHPTVALEEGHSTLTHEQSGWVEYSGYSAIHVKDGSKWLISLARDWPEQVSAAEQQLRQLSWLIGDWVDEGSGSAIATAYKRSADGKSILGESTVHIDGRPTMTVTTRIGWNPATEQIHSWTFDSEGGFSEGDWTHDGNRWTVPTKGIAGNGQVCSATNIYTQISDHTFAFQSVNRVVGGNTAPDIAWSVSARKPPAPK